MPRLPELEPVKCVSRIPDETATDIARSVAVLHELHSVRPLLQPVLDALMQVDGGLVAEDKSDFTNLFPQFRERTPVSVRIDDLVEFTRELDPKTDHKIYDSREWGDQSDSPFQILNTSWSSAFSIPVTFSKVNNDRRIFGNQEVAIGTVLPETQQLIVEGGNYGEPGVGDAEEFVFAALVSYKNSRNTPGLIVASSEHGFSDCYEILKNQIVSGR